MSDSATWLKRFLAPLEILWNGVKQNRDDRLDFRDGFIASQEVDALGVNVLTLKTDVGAATETPDASKVVKRNASGVAYAFGFTADPGGSFSYSSAKSVTVVEPMRVLEPIDAVTGWTIISGGMAQANVVGLTWTAEITPPDGCALTEIAVRLVGKSGHVALPGSMPYFEIASVDGDGNIVALGGPFPDASVDMAAYEVPHDITSGVINVSVDRSANRYFVILTTESGADSLVETVVIQPARWTADIVSL